MHMYKNMQQFRCASRHRFSGTRVTKSLPESCVIFTMKWLLFAIDNVQLCCMLLFWIDGVIYHFKAALGTEMRQQHWRKEDSIGLQESCRINFEASFISQLVSAFIFLCHFSLSHISTFLTSSILRCQKTLEAHVEAGKPSMPQAKGGSQQMLPTAVPVSGLCMCQCL